MKIKTIVEFKRFSEKELKHVTEKKEITDILDICAESDHKFCHHNDYTVVLRNKQISTVQFYPALKKIVVYLKDR